MPQPPVTPGSYGRHITPTLIVSVIVLLVLAGAAYAGIWWWGNHNASPVAVTTFMPRPSASASPTSDISTWKTYTNAYYGLDLKYPDNWEILDSSPANAKVLNINLRDKTSTGQEWPGLTLSSADLSQDYSNAKSYGGFNLADANKDQIAVKINSQRGVLYAICQIDNSGKTLTVCNQILATFTLTPVDTSTWKTYTNTQYGFSFMYQPLWVQQSTTDPNRVDLIIYGPNQQPGDGVVVDSANLSIYIEAALSPQEISVQTGDLGPFSDQGFTGVIRYSTQAPEQDWGDWIEAYKTLADGKILRIHWLSANQGSSDFSYQKYLLPILSTFKFTQ